MKFSTSLAFRMSMPGFLFTDFLMRHALSAMQDWETLMDSYLVRVYRKEQNNPRILVGVLEESGVKEKKAFHNLYELWDILNPLRRGGTAGGKQKIGKGNRKTGK